MALPASGARLAIGRVARGDGAFPNAVDFEGTAAVSGDLDQFFAEIDTERGDSLISFGWIMAEELLNYGS